MSTPPEARAQLVDDSMATSPRDAAGKALRDFLKPGSVVWAELSDDRRAMWRANADVVVTAAFTTMVTTAVDRVARVLFEQHHQAAGTLTEWTMGEWDAGDQHVNRDPWRARARQVLDVVEAAYRETGHVVS